MMEAIILAGGFGTRLKTVVQDVPKPMADICGKPFLFYLLENLSVQHIDHVLMSLGYKAEIVRKYFGDRFMDIQISYIIEDAPLGTGGALKKAMTKTSSKDVFVLNGDTYFDVNYAKMYAYHEQKDAQLTMAVKHMHRVDRYGSINFDKISGRILSFEEKTFRQSCYINGGVLLVNRDIFNCDHPVEADKFSFETDFLVQNIRQISCYAFFAEGIFIDIGTPEDYRNAQNLLQSRVLP